MKGVVAVLALIMGLSVAASGAGSIISMDLAKDLHQASSSDFNSFENKLANVLKDVHPDRSLSSQVGNIEDNRGVSSSGIPSLMGALSKDNSINGSSTNGTSIDGSPDNSTSINMTALNQSVLNSSALSPPAGAPALISSLSSAVSTAGAGGMVPISYDPSVSPEVFGSEAKGSFHGFWCMDANKGGIGKAKIKSHTYLSGGFDVDKTVKFSDR